MVVAIMLWSCRFSSTKNVLLIRLFLTGDERELFVWRFVSAGTLLTRRDLFAPIDRHQRLHDVVSLKLTGFVVFALTITVYLLILYRSGVYICCCSCYPGYYLLPTCAVLLSSWLQLPMVVPLLRYHTEQSACPAVPCWFQQLSLPHVRVRGVFIEVRDAQS